MEAHLIRGNRFHDIDHGVFLFGHCAEQRHEIQISENQFWHFSSPAVWIQPKNPGDEHQVITIHDNLFANPTEPRAVPIRLRRKGDIPSTPCARYRSLTTRFGLRDAHQEACDALSAIAADGYNLLITGNLIDLKPKPWTKERGAAHCLDVGSPKTTEESTSGVSITECLPL